jgi:hypothetical protein
MARQDLLSGRSVLDPEERKRSRKPNIIDDFRESMRPVERRTMTGGRYEPGLGYIPDAQMQAAQPDEAELNVLRERAMRRLVQDRQGGVPGGAPATSSAPSAPAFREAGFGDEAELGRTAQALELHQARARDRLRTMPKGAERDRLANEIRDLTRMRRGVRTLGLTGPNMPDRELLEVRRGHLRESFADAIGKQRAALGAEFDDLLEQGPDAVLSELGRREVERRGQGHLLANASPDFLPFVGRQTITEADLEPGNRGQLRERMAEIEAELARLDRAGTDGLDLPSIEELGQDVIRRREALPEMQRQAVEVARQARDFVSGQDRRRTFDADLEQAGGEATLAELQAVQAEARARGAAAAGAVDGMTEKQLASLDRERQAVDIKRATEETTADPVVTDAVERLKAASTDDTQAVRIATAAVNKVLDGNPTETEIRAMASALLMAKSSLEQETILGDVLGFKVEASLDRQDLTGKIDAALKRIRAMRGKTE